MTLHNVLIALGSNTGNRQGNLSEALVKCKDFIQTNRLSPVIETKPIGHTNNPYLNQLFSGTTSLTLEKLLDNTKRIENEMGRDRSNRGNVAIDIDIILYDQQKLHFTDWERDYIKQLLTQLKTEL
ncbi:MAG: 2-amino-4-hydroxy-6-hydroxymethyldihydropteridine diphosphokinase [Prevotella sp.]|nr:2-amino-4-hydroxy-6-hydroxymethyldihydropteridine diphosphokinase [Prevotella sp.]